MTGAERRKKVLFVNPGNVPFTEASLLIEPIDVLSVASFAAALGHDVTVRDFDRERVAERDAFAVLESLRPEVVVIPFDYHIPLFTSEAMPGVREIVQMAAELGSRVVTGGKAAKKYPELFLASPECVSVHGEMEPALEELLSLDEWSEESLKRVKGISFLSRTGVQHTQPRTEPFDIRKLPLPDRSLLPASAYIDVRSILTSRSCVERCRFCSVHQFWGRWRMRTPESVVNEIEALVCNGAEKIIFLDDNAMAGGGRMRRISSLLAERRLPVALGCLGTSSSCEPSLLALMHEAGFRWIHIGAESGSNKVLSALNKSTTVEMNTQAFENCRKAGLRIRTSWILDAPSMDSDDLRRTVDAMLAGGSDEIRAHFFTLRTDSPFCDEFMRDEREHASMPEQYIHSSHPLPRDPRLGKKMSCGISEDFLREELQRLCYGLSSKGYRVIHEPSEWASLSAAEISDPDFRFISFCPARYGIGWRTETCRQ